MFVLFKGECGIYINSGTANDASNQTAVAVIKENQVTGEKAVMSNENSIRLASVIAHSDVTTLVLKKKDY